MGFLIHTHKAGSSSGFSLLEVVLSLAVLAVIIGVLAPVGFQEREGERKRQTRQQLQEIYRGLLGDPDRQTFGYVGDIGDLPDALGDLITKPVGFPDYNTSNTNKVGMGWRGPYVDRGFFPGDEFKDEWGTLFEYGGKTGTGGGRTGRGQIRSGGPDKVMGTSDDTLFPLKPIVTDSTLLMTVHVVEGGKEPPKQQFIPNATECEVSVFKTVNGAEALQETQTTPSTGQSGVPRRGFSFTLHHGPHAVRVRHYKDSSKKPEETVEKIIVVTVRAQTQVLIEPRLVHVGAGIKSL